MIKIEELNIQVVSLLCNEYPHYLKECPDAPIALFIKGTLPIPEKFALGIVGTRTPSEYGKMSTIQIIEECRGYDIVIISGLAMGIDTIAHQHALAANIPTIAILAHGFQYMYPAQHKNLAIEIIKKGGALISEYPPTTKIERHHFAARNRIIAGWSNVLAVIESGEKGGSLRTATFAAQYNRDVIAIPGRWIDTKSLGVNHLIFSNQAEILIHPTNIQNYLPKKELQDIIQSTSKINLSSAEFEILDLFKNQSILHFDEVLRGLTYSIADLTHKLFLMELKGLIQCLPGKFYRIKV